MPSSTVVAPTRRSWTCGFPRRRLRNSLRLVVPWCRRWSTSRRTTSRADGTTPTRSALSRRVAEILEVHAPGLSSSVVGDTVLAPADIEARYGTTGGHLHHGEEALDQILVRPAPECSRYKTPVPDLTLCGSGSHPGGGLTCAPGMLAARSILAG